MAACQIRRRGGGGQWVGMQGRETNEDKKGRGEEDSKVDVGVGGYRQRRRRRKRRN